MEYLSTRGGIEEIGFREAVMMGLARDGGLLLPATVPDVRPHLARWRELPYLELTVEIIGLFADLPEEDLRELVQTAYASFRHDDIAPVVRVGDVHVLELFHGPTLAFKDLALQFLGGMFAYLLAEGGSEMNILGATSGDTGSAAIAGVRGRDRIRIFVMHPHQRVSEIQARQMTSVLDDNVFNMAVEGTFDDCQRIMKVLFQDLRFKDRYALGAVNSINWARIVAQIVYYFYAAFRVMESTGAERCRFAVPTGNFGDIFAGYLATRMGLPVSKLVLATNQNDILARFFATGNYSMGEVSRTLSPSMDIQVASNFERYLYYRTGEDPMRVRAMMAGFGSDGRLGIEPHTNGVVDELFLAGKADKQATLTEIRETYRQHDYLLDPHTAVGMSVARNHLQADEPMICLATAHPAKFGGAIEEALGSDIARHPVLEAIRDLPTRCEVLPATVQAVRNYIRDHIESS